MIYHGRGILAHESKNRRAEVYMGIEAIVAEPAKVQFVVGLPREEFRAALRGKAKQLASLSRLHGLRLQRLDDGECVHIGVELPAKATPQQEATVIQALTEISRHLGMAEGASVLEQIKAARSLVAAMLGKGGEWRSFAVADVKLLESERVTPGFTATAVMPAKCTFADETPAELRLQTGLAEQEFARFPAYRGLAVRSYESYRPKVAEEKSPAPAQAKELQPRE